MNCTELFTTGLRDEPDPVPSAADLRRRNSQIRWVCSDCRAVVQSPVADAEYIGRTEIMGRGRGCLACAS